MFILGLLFAVLTAFSAFLALTVHEYDFVYGILAIVLGFMAAFTLEAAVNEYSCEKVWSMSNTPSNYSVFTGCMIHIDGKWFSADNYREIEK